MIKKNLLIVAVLCLSVLLVLGATHACKNYSTDGSDRQVIGGRFDVVSGGILDLKSGSLLQISDSNATGILKASSGQTATLTDSSANWDTAYNDVIYSVEVDVNNTVLLALQAAPKQLIAQPGSGKLIELISAVVFLDYGSAALTEPNDLNLQYATSNSVIAAVEDTGLLDQTADTLTVVKPATLAGVAASNCVNQAVELANSGTKEYENATGSALKIYLTYRIRSGF